MIHCLCYSQGINKDIYRIVILYGITRLLPIHSQTLTWILLSWNSNVSFLSSCTQTQRGIPKQAVNNRMCIFWCSINCSLFLSAWIAKKPYSKAASAISLLQWRRCLEKSKPAHTQKSERLLGMFAVCLSSNIYFMRCFAKRLCVVHLGPCRGADGPGGELLSFWLYFSTQASVAYNKTRLWKHSWVLTCTDKLEYQQQGDMTKRPLQALCQCLVNT